MDSKPSITDFSHELLCHILKYLPLREILSVAMLCKKMLVAVNMHLQLCKSVDFCQDSIFGYMPSTITDDHLLTLLKKCPHLEVVYGLHPTKIERRRLRKRAALTIPGIIEALSLCFHLKAIETSDLRLFEAIMQHLPQLEIIGHFQNRNGLFPPQSSQRLKLQPYPRISSLHLIGVEVPELTAMPHLQHLHLQCVRFTKLQPFRAFLAQNLKSFVMKHCIGPSVPQRYLSLIIALSSSPNLSHLELVRVPLLNGLFQRAVEDSYRHNGFVNLRTLVISGCKGILEADLGHLMIIASKNLETLYIQPSLTKDSLFVSLSFAQCSFPVLRNLHLGYIDNLNSSSEWSNDALLSFGLAEVPDTPSSLTDSGMKVLSQLFPHIKTLSVSNCPHLMVMYHWMAEEDLEAWSRLTDLTLQKCHCLQLSSFILFISFLPNIQVVILNDMFREPPKGCSHVGLSAGTGLGMSSAVVSNQDEHIAVQGHHQEFEPPGDEENEEIDREFIDVENEDNPEPQFMVLQRDFFDGEDNEGAVDNPPLENGQDQNLEDREQDIIGNEVNNNSLSSENIAISNENNLVEESFSSPLSETFTCENQSCKINESKCCLRNSNKKFKSSNSDCIQENILSQDSCYSIDSEEKKIIKNETLDEDYCNSEINTKVHTEDLHEYDPHKPSTSKAGNYFDYSDRDEEYNCSKSMKRSNKCSDYQNLTKKQKQSFKLFKDITADEKIKKDCEISSQNNSFENNLSSHILNREENYSNCVKQELSENTTSFQVNSNKIPSSINSGIPSNISCYVLVKKLEIDICKKYVSHDENKDDGGSTVKVDKDNLSGMDPCCDCLYDDSFKNTLNDNQNNMKQNTYAHVIPSKKTSSDTYSKKCYSFVKSEKECLHMNTKQFNDDYKTEATLDNPEINEVHIDENVHNTSNLESDCEISINSLKVTNSVSTNKLSNKNNIYELSEHEILLDDSFNEPTEETSIDHDMLHAPIDENSSDFSIEDEKKVLTGIQTNSVTRYKSSVATQTSVNETLLVHSPVNKSLKIFKSNLHKSDENMVIEENSFEKSTSENLKRDDSLDLSKIIKPCCVLLKRENIHAYPKKYSDDDSGNLNKNSDKIPHDLNSEQVTCDYLPTLDSDENLLKEETLSSNLDICDCLQPSTSKAEINICSNSNRNSKNFKKMHSSKYFKRRKSPVSTRSKSVNFNTIKSASRNEIKYYPVPKLPNVKNAAGCNSRIDLSESNTKLCPHNHKELEKRSEIDRKDNNYNEDARFYASISNNGSLEIINPVTGKSHLIPHCHVLLTQMNNESNDNFHKMSKCKDKVEESQDSQKSFSEHYDNAEINQNLPSTSKSESHTITVSNISKNVTCLNKCNLLKKKQSSIRCFRCKNLSECCCNYSVVVNCNSKKLSIKNSDAMILLKQSNKKNDKYNIHQQISSQLNSHDTSRFENEVCNTSREQKFNNETNIMQISENSSCANEIASDNSLGNNESSSSEEKANNVASCTPQKQRRRRKTTTFIKRIKKSFNYSKVKINKLSRGGTKNSTKRTTSLRMISLVSQGSQATSADIRRSVRRIRRAAAQRKTVQPVYTSSSRYSSKISAKALIKRPVSTIPRPESHDKATSTSDPLLEDDAVQTLQLSSCTLLSFTVVSCGISDLIIDQCPKLTHIEVQACRILKRFQFNNSPSIKRLNVSQCPKLNICAIAAPVMSLSSDTYFLVSYEPCMQGYHPGEGEKAILSKASLNQSVLILHDFCAVSHDGIQAKFREKTLEWLRFISQLHLYLNYAREKVKKKKCKSEVYQFSDYPWSHDLRRMHGQYSYSSSDFCDTERRYQLLTNNPIFCDIFQTALHDSGFPDVADCAAFKDLSSISHEVMKKYIEMQKKFVAFYIPVTENNQISF